MVLKKAYLLVELLVSIAIFTIFALSIYYMISIIRRMEVVLVNKTLIINNRIQEHEIANI